MTWYTCLVLKGEIDMIKKPSAKTATGLNPKYAIIKSRVNCSYVVGQLARTYLDLLPTSQNNVEGTVNF